MSGPQRHRPATRATTPQTPERGQAVVEFAMVIPIMLVILAGVLEFGLVANDSLTIGYGSREGARAGSALGTGGATDCKDGDDPAGVDPAIVAGVQRIIESSGSAVKLSDIRRDPHLQGHAVGRRSSRTI